MLPPRPNRTVDDLAAHVLSLRTHGVTVVSGVLSAEELPRLRTVVAELMAGVRELHPGQQPASVECILHSIIPFTWPIPAHSSE